jgi:alkylation response protein AidB-like acyl-CoA dehydrogenase
MNAADLRLRFREIAGESIPFPGSGHMIGRLQRLFELGREDLSLARLAEAHFDAVAILAEAGRMAQPNTLYGVWASEVPGKSLMLTETAGGVVIQGAKSFCSGAGIVDRALITVSAPDSFLVDMDLRANEAQIALDNTVWMTCAFSLTNTATIEFRNVAVSCRDILLERAWYLSRPGFWHGACGPAACWAGGAAGLVDYALKQSRSDPHTLAHVGAMHSLVWQMKSCLESAATEIDALPTVENVAQVRALTVRHLVEQACTEILHRFARAYGPYPLAFDGEISRRYQELDIYLRQCHAERDLEALGKEILGR